MSVNDIHLVDMMLVVDLKSLVNMVDNLAAEEVAAAAGVDVVEEIFAVAEVVVAEVVEEDEAAIIVLVVEEVEGVAEVAALVDSTNHSIRQIKIKKSHLTIKYFTFLHFKIYFPILIFMIFKLSIKYFTT